MLLHGVDGDSFRFRRGGIPESGEGTPGVRVKVGL